MNRSICGVVILYNPEKESVGINLRLIANQVDSLILIDNSPVEIGSHFFSDQSEKTFEYIYNNNKGGIAGAQNIGIKRAEALGSSHIILFDQDSVPNETMVSTLISDLDYLCQEGEKVAVIGPQAINNQTKKAYKPRIKKDTLYANNPTLEIQKQIISSGSLFPIAIFKVVGYMDESLFIDGVDHEWCWRAKVKGYSSFISTNTVMLHMLGEGDRKFLGINVAVTSSFRLFYQYRNYIVLFKRSYVPLYWKVNNGVKYFVKLFFYGMVVKPRLRNLRNITKGIIAGFKVRR